MIEKMKKVILHFIASIVIVPVFIGVVFITIIERILKK